MSYCRPHQARFVIFLLAAAIPLVPLGTSHTAVAHVLSDTATDAKKKPTTLVQCSPLFRSPNNGSGSMAARA